MERLYKFYTVFLKKKLFSYEWTTCVAYLHGTPLVLPLINATSLIHLPFDDLILDSIL